MKMGDVYPRLRQLPGYEEIAEREYSGNPVNPIRQPGPPAIDPAVRDAVLACPARGPEGALPLLDSERSCCGGGPEMTACARGLGKIPGRVTLRDCLDCANKAIQAGDG